MKKKATKKATSKKAKQMKLYKSDKEKLIQMNVRVTKQHMKELKGIAKQLGVSESEAIRRMIMAGLQHPFKGQKRIAPKKQTEKQARARVKQAIQPAVEYKIESQGG